MLFKIFACLSKSQIIIFSRHFSQVRKQRILFFCNFIIILGASQEFIRTTTETDETFILYTAKSTSINEASASLQKAKTIDADPDASVRIDPLNDPLDMSLYQIAEGTAENDIGGITENVSCHL